MLPAGSAVFTQSRGQGLLLAPKVPYGTFWDTRGGSALIPPALQPTGSGPACIIQNPHTELKGPSYSGPQCLLYWAQPARNLSTLPAYRHRGLQADQETYKHCLIDGSLVRAWDVKQWQLKGSGQWPRAAITPSSQLLKARGCLEKGGSIMNHSILGPSWLPFPTGVLCASPHFFARGTEPRKERGNVASGKA